MAEISFPYTIKGSDPLSIVWELMVAKDAELARQIGKLPTDEARRRWREKYPDDFGGTDIVGSVVH